MCLFGVCFKKRLGHIALFFCTLGLILICFSYLKIIVQQNKELNRKRRNYI